MYILSFLIQSSQVDWPGVRCCLHQLPEKGGMGQLPIKLLKTDEVAKTCIPLFGARISTIGKCSNQEEKEIKD